MKLLLQPLVRFRFCFVVFPLLTAVAEPTIVVPPTNKTVSAGFPLLSTVAAQGSGELVYEWRFATGGQIPAVISPWSTNALLSIPLMTPDNAGHYWVVVKDSSGAVTNPPIHVRVLTWEMAEGGGFLLRVYNRIGGVAHEVQGSSDLVSWVRISSASNLVQHTVLHNPDPHLGQYFYRVIPTPP